MLKVQKRTFIFLCSLAFILSFSVQATAALLPTLADYFSRDAVDVGGLVWIYMLSYGLCALIWSPLSRRFSVKKILLFCLSVFSLSAFGVTFSTSLEVAFFGRLGMGIFGSAIIPLGLITIGKEYPSRDRPKYLGLFFATGYSSGLLGVFLSGILPWRFIYGIPFLLGVLALIVGFYYLDDIDLRSEFKISYFDTFRDKSSLKLFAFIFFLSLFYHSIHQWLGVYLSREHNFSQFAVSSALTVSTIAAIFSESFGGFLSSRFGSSNIASLGLLSMAVFLLSVLFVGPAQAIFFLIIFWGLGWAFNHVGLSSFLTGLPDKFLRDASSLNSSLRFVSGGIGTFLGGKVISRFGFLTHFIFIAVLLLGIAILIKKTLIVNKPVNYLNK